MLRSCEAATSASGSDHSADDEAERVEEHKDAVGEVDLVAQDDNRVHAPESLDHHDKDVLEQPDGADHPDDVGAKQVPVTGAGKEALLEEASGEQGRKPQGLRSPTAPTPEEYATHVLTHIPYRNWCWHCVASRRPNAAHRLSKRKQDRNIPLLTIDYAHLRDSKDEATIPCVTVLPVPFNVGAAFLVDAKGEDDDAVKRLSEFIVRVGLHRFQYVLNSDQEWPLEALVQKAAALADRKRHKGT